MPCVVCRRVVDLIELLITGPDASGGIGCRITSYVAEEDCGIIDCTMLAYIRH
jgi:hypothetical protein